MRRMPWLGMGLAACYAGFGLMARSLARDYPPQAALEILGARTPSGLINGEIWRYVSALFLTKSMAIEWGEQISCALGVLVLAFFAQWVLGFGKSAVVSVTAVGIGVAVTVFAAGPAGVQGYYWLLAFIGCVVGCGVSYDKTVGWIVGVAHVALTANLLWALPNPEKYGMLTATTVGAVLGGWAVLRAGRKETQKGCEKCSWAVAACLLGVTAWGMWRPASDFFYYSRTKEWRLVKASDWETSGKDLLDFLAAPAFAFECRVPSSWQTRLTSARTAEFSQSIGTLDVLVLAPGQGMEDLIQADKQNATTQFGSGILEMTEQDYPFRLGAGRRVLIRMESGEIQQYYMSCGGEIVRAILILTGPSRRELGHLAEISRFLGSFQNPRNGD